MTLRLVLTRSALLAIVGLCVGMVETAHAQAELPASRPSALTARYHVRQMESVLERAVQHAADIMRRRLQSVTPDVLALAGAPRAQGFRIDGYGLFFSVEVPRLSESVNWALRVLSQDQDERVLASLRKVAGSEQDPALRADIERAIRSIELRLAGASATAAGPERRASVASAAREPALTESAHVGSAPELSAEAAAAAQLAQDPNGVYESVVKDALVDAMLDYAGSIELPVGEWVTVAARDAGYVAFPDSVNDMVTVTLSVRVADLREFRAQRLTRDEARSRVVMREF